MPPIGKSTVDIEAEPRRIGIGFVYPKRFERAVCVQRAVYSNAFVVDAYAVLARSARRKRAERAGTNEDDYGKQKIAHPQRDAGPYNRNKAERPIPIVGALFVHMGDHVPGDTG